VGPQINKLGDVMYAFPFSLPPFYIAIIRCLGVLEGLAIQVDRNFRIINDAYPYIASRLLTDPSPELQAALRQLIFKNNKPRCAGVACAYYGGDHASAARGLSVCLCVPRWERLEELLEVATDSTDYDVTLAMDQLLDYMLSEQGDYHER
jgi:aarF domain-containing kinase